MPVIPGNPDVPSSARVYSYLTGGHDWYEADQKLATKLEGVYPGVRRMAVNNRAWLQHAALHAVAHLGITQFLDLGSGFPDDGSVRAHAQAASPDAVVVCVDWDPVVAGPDGYGPMLDEAGVKGVNVILADIRDPAAILGHPGVTGLIDLDRPVCAVAGLVAHSMTPGEAAGMTAGYMARLAPGSCLAATVGHTADPDLAARIAEAYPVAQHYYDPDQIEGLFAGLDVLPPGVGPIAGCRPGWRSARNGTPGPSYVIGGIATKPLPRRHRA